MNTFIYKGWRLLTAISDEEAKQLFELIQEGEIEVSKWLKQHSRSDVMAFNFKEKKLVLKIPKEKNRRKWIRFTSLYRKGEAFSNLLSMERLQSINIPTTKPVMAAENRENGMIKDSWTIYEYIEGESCLGKASYYPEVINLLHQIHQHGLVHSDPQIRNFILNRNKLFVIDSKPSKPLLGSFSRAYEFAYLKKSAPGIESFFGEIKNSLLFKLAVKYDVYERKFATFKKKLKFKIHL